MLFLIKHGKSRKYPWLKYILVENRLFFMLSMSHAINRLVLNSLCSYSFFDVSF